MCIVFSYYDTIVEALVKSVNPRLWPRFIAPCVANSILRGVYLLSYENKFISKQQKILKYSVSVRQITFGSICFAISYCVLKVRLFYILSRASSDYVDVPLEPVITYLTQRFHRDKGAA